MKPVPAAKAPGEQAKSKGTRAGSPQGVQWGKSANLMVTFLEDPGASMKATVLAHMNAWGADPKVAVSFTEGAGGQIRISFVAGDGNWSEIGSRAKNVADDAATMNLDIDGISSTSIVRRIVMHEAGHCLGLVHEHMRQPLVDKIDPVRAIQHFANLNGWSEAETRRQVLTPIADADLLHDGGPDPDSIMAYFIPGSITTDGQPILGSTRPSARDIAFVARLYPGEP